MGTIYSINPRNYIRWWNYDLASDSPGLSPILKTASNGEEESIGNVKKFIFDKNNEFVIGYKTFSGETYPTLTMDEMKAFWGIPDD